MATSPVTPYSSVQNNYYNPGNNYSTTDPRKIASQTRQGVASQGQQLYNQNNQAANQNQQLVGQTAGYLNNVEDPLAQGKGGYNQQEVSNIEMTPEQQQSIVTGAGISAGANTAAATQAAQQATNAAGGNPLALAAYRQREAQQQGAQAGDAETQARIGAQEAGSQETQAVGNARLAQQNQGLNYYQGQNAQANQNVTQAQNRNQQTYGTETGGETQAGNTAVSASQTPSTLDKVVGGIAGFLEDGDVAPGETVVGEGGNAEKIVQTQTANGPDQGAHTFLDDGGFGDTDTGGEGIGGATPAPNASDVGVGGQPWWKKGLQSVASSNNQPQPQMGGGQSGSNSQWNPTTPYRQAGQAAGKILSAFLEDGGVTDSFMDSGGYTPQQFAPSQYSPAAAPQGGMPQGANGIFTRPTKVKLGAGEAVVPLTDKPRAKTRPSMAALPAAHQRTLYRGGARV